MTESEMRYEIATLRLKIASLELSEETAWKRWREANAMTNSYIAEFEKRGLQYEPKPNE
jgi:hypothetical protein